MLTKDDIKFLQNIKLFDGLKLEDIEKFCSIMNPVSFKAGEIIVQEGEEGDSMYIFREGKVEITHHITLRLKSGQWEEAEKAMAVLDAKTVGFFGEMSLVTGAPRSATIKAITDCKLYEIHRDTFEIFALKEPYIAYRIMFNIAKVLSNRVRNMNENILKLTTALSIALSRRKK